MKALHSSTSLQASLTALALAGAAACGEGVPVPPGAAASALNTAPLAPSGAGACPTFHCNPEATGAMTLSLDASAYPVSWQNDTSGTMIGQGCSGDGTILACLFASDASNTGTLKVFDPVAKRELWASNASATKLSSNAGTGQVPYVAENGDIFASDDRNLFHYDHAGSLVGSPLPLAGSRGATSFGVVAVDDTTAFVNQKNGVLTVVDLASLTSKGTVTLATATGVRLNLASPASAHGMRAYVVTTEASTRRSAGASLGGGTGSLGNGYLVAVDVKRNAAAQRWSFPYQGASGASAVVVPPSVSGNPHPIILVHTPAPAGETAVNDQLVAIEDAGETDGGAPYRVLWSKDLGAAVQVAPLVDAVNHVFYLHLKGEHVLHAFDFGGTELAPYDLRAIGAAREPPQPFSDLVLNGHLVGTFTAGRQTVLLSGSASGAQFVMGLDPATRTLQWVTRTAATADKYTAAWTIQKRAAGACPIFVGASTGINVLCP